MIRASFLSCAVLLATTLAASACPTAAFSAYGTRAVSRVAYAATADVAADDCGAAVTQVGPAYAQGAAFLVRTFARSSYGGAFQQAFAVRIHSRSRAVAIVPVSAFRVRAATRVGRALLAGNRFRVVARRASIGGARIVSRSRGRR